ncbi:NACHT, LRR and PYD domains-containing protein 1b allele 2-like isoform X2 [Myripristis murdjan]|nr:caspase recruitment domain-containing protein 18 isoform X2 [Myripristis murdjan]
MLKQFGLKDDCDQLYFTPAMSVDRGSTLYRFKFPGSGIFRCALTRLVFIVVGEGEVQYRTVQWDELLLHTARKTPAGPLFSIECAENVIRQLHFPHYDLNAGGKTDSLSVAHITSDGVSFLKPVEITEIHVIVQITHLSTFGIVWNYLRSVLTLSISAQILLFQRSVRGPRQFLDVLLLPTNVPLHEVKAQQEDAVYIQTACHCRLTTGQSYTLGGDPEPYRIQPRNATFDLNYGPNYHPTFVVTVDRRTTDQFRPSASELKLMVQDEERTVWEYQVDMRDAFVDFEQRRRSLPCPQIPSPEEKKLLDIRTNFIGRVSGPVLDVLLDELLQLKVINSREKESASKYARARKAEVLIDMVRGKGPEASSAMIRIFCEQDPFLSRLLQLNQSREERLDDEPGTSVSKRERRERGEMRSLP